METSVVTQSASKTQIYNQAARLLIEEKQSSEQAIQSLISTGVDELEATTAVEDLHGQIIAAKKKHAEKDMLYGALWCVGGTVATLANIGFIFWGAIVFGGIQFFRGVINHTSAK
ncbi:hypothetical protein [Pinibacter aurantiacus]|uniref:Uncharacterized protein n=1 Tax=Pinibacter aurantiacus TaxID=2851599 RepID=A0A9E2W723_9BACT|nr:hypothetical protein [Pinibacter aurantiacus]MBV4360513.1 hypothetical protein [Pinibacter aurantiacus]